VNYLISYCIFLQKKMNALVIF